jgi:putative peptidoglycan lipid II flippase
MTTPAHGEASSTGSAVTRDSMAVSAWTLVSRITGFARTAVIAAVLGPTYLGNTFQAVNGLPNIITYELLMGSLFASLLVPALVGHVRREDRRGAERVAGGFLGVVTLGFLVVAALGILGGRPLLRLFAAGVEDPSVASAQHRVGWLLLIAVMPQVPLYGVVAVAMAAQNAHGRFVLPAAAPVLENLGLILTLVMIVLLFGRSGEVQSVPLDEVLLLGLGSTGAVALHAAAQWWGLWRLGIRLRPRAGWRDADVRQLLRRLLPSTAYAWLSTLRWLAVLVAANQVAGGVVAFQLASNFFNLAAALGVASVGTALLPRLARLYQARELGRFRRELNRGTALVYFLIVPAAVGYAVLCRHLAAVVSFGRMSTSMGVALVAASLAALAPGLLGNARFHLGFQASYACDQMRPPLLASLAGAAVALVGILVTLLLPPGVVVLLVLGLAFSAGELVAGADLGRRLNRFLPAGRQPGTPLIRALAAATVMAVPAYAVATLIGGAGPAGHPASLTGLLAGGATGIAVYLGLQRLWRSPELDSLLASLPRIGARPTGAAGP